MLDIPAALKTEHENLHADLSAAIKVPSQTGQAAKRVAAVLHEHFVSEEEFAMPPLGLLGTIAEGRATAEMSSVITLTDRLKREMPRMLEEHKEDRAGATRTRTRRQSGRPSGGRPVRGSADAACTNRGAGVLPGCHPGRRVSEAEVSRRPVMP
jgi:hypothetical protein